MARTFRLIHLQLFILSAAVNFFVPTAKRKGEGGRVNDIIVQCRHCRQDVNVAGISGPWKCPHCGKRSDD